MWPGGVAGSGGPCLGGRSQVGGDSGERGLLGVEVGHRRGVYVGEGRLTGAMAVQVKGDVGLRKSRPERGQGLRDDDDVRASYPKEPCC